MTSLIRRSSSSLSSGQFEGATRLDKARYSSSSITPSSAITFISRSSTFNASRPDKTLVVTGGTATVTPALTDAALSKYQYDRVVLVGRRMPQLVNGTTVVFEQADPKGDMLRDRGFWGSIFKKYASPQIDVINTLGSAIAPKGSTIQSINVEPVEAVVSALESEQRTGRGVAVANFSTICASIFPEDPEMQRKYFCEQAISYVKSRLEAENILNRSDIPTAISLRPGYIFKDIDVSGKINTEHPYSPEQFAKMFFQFILGSGEQIQQPVYMGDLIDSMLTTFKNGGVRSAIDAVGPEAMTQQEMFEFFVRLAGNKPRMVKVPDDLAFVIAKHVPKGRIAPYAVAAFKLLDEPHLRKPLDGREFRDSVGKDLTSMTQLYSNMSERCIVLQKPPIRQHVKEILTLAKDNPSALMEITYMMMKYGPEMVISAIRTLFA